MAKLSFFVGLALGATAALMGSKINQAAASVGSHGHCEQTYPNVPGRLLLENEFVVVQRFSFPPGQWEGVHAHPPNQLYIHLSDAHWVVRFGDRTESFFAEVGSVGWFGPVDLSEDHESLNAGDAPIDLVWVTMKETCHQDT